MRFTLNSSQNKVAILDENMIDISLYPTSNNTTTLTKPMLVDKDITLTNYSAVTWTVAVDTTEDLKINNSTSSVTIDAGQSIQIRFDYVNNNFVIAGRSNATGGGGGNVSKNTTISTFNGSSIILDYPELSYAEYPYTNSTTISVASTNVIGAGAILLLKADGSHTPSFTGATLSDSSSFTTTNNYINPIVFYNRGDQIIYRYMTPYLSANIAPIITVQPSNQTVTTGSNVTFSVTATGNPTLTYQWRVSTDNVTYNDIVGATSSSYTFSTVIGDNGKYFKCVITNAFGSVTSNTATLTVNALVAPIFYFSLNQTRDKVIAIADKSMTTSPSFAGITVSGGKTITAAVRNTANTTNTQYDLTLSSAYLFTDTPTITIPASLWTATDGGVYGGVTSGSISKFWQRNGFVVESTANNFTSNTATAFAATGYSSVPLVGDFSIQADIAASVGRGAILGVNTNNANEAYTSYEFYVLENVGAVQIISGKNGANVNTTTNNLSTDTQIRIRRVSGTFISEVFRSGVWTTIYTQTGTDNSLMYPSFTIYDNTVGSPLNNILIS